MEAPFKEKPIRMPEPKFLPRTQEEWDLLSKAEDEYRKTGKITAVCPRCGGRIVYYECGNSYSVGCERDKCFRMDKHKCPVCGWGNCTDQNENPNRKNDYNRMSLSEAHESYKRCEKMW